MRTLGNGDPGERTVGQAVCGRDQGTAGFPKDELGGNRDGLGFEGGIGDAVEDHFYHAFPDLLGEFANGGEAGVEQGADSIVVAADDADVVGNAQTAVANPFVNAVGRLVIAGEDGSDLLFLAEKGFGREIAGFVVIFGINAALLRREASLKHGAAVPLKHRANQGRRVFPTNHMWR